MENPTPGHKEEGKPVGPSGPAKPEKDLFIVGIALEADDLPLLQTFFAAMPADARLACLVMISYPSGMLRSPDPLPFPTTMPVIPLSGHTTVEPGHIYLVPTRRRLIMEGLNLSVSMNRAGDEVRAPSDELFRMLASSHGPRSVAVILSGKTLHATTGLKYLKEMGGVCFVHDQYEKAFSAGPPNTIVPGLFDEVLPATEIPARILAYKSLSEQNRIKDAVQNPDDVEQTLQEIFSVLRKHTGHNFSEYKRRTLLNRIERRLILCNMPDLAAYALFLRDNPPEVSVLMKDLLISVTSFFRDRESFAIVVHELLPLIFNSKPEGEPVRIWVAGCATGEEAYSLAILCAERSVKNPGMPNVQIFATDINESAIAYAREGVYNAIDVADLGTDRLRQFFVKEGHAYRIRSEVRDLILFERHDFLQDPPFSQLDMVSCRNVMIYLNHQAKDALLKIFRFALGNKGYLFLGSSETVGNNSWLFAVYNHEHHIFLGRDINRQHAIADLQPGQYTIQHKEAVREDNRPPIRGHNAYCDLHQKLVDEYIPPSLLINEAFEILYLTERAGDYLQVNSGEPSKNLLRLIRPELMQELRSALYQAVHQQSVVKVDGLMVIRGDRKEAVSIRVRPVLRSDANLKGMMLVVFEPVVNGTRPENISLQNEPLIQRLEEELKRSKKQLRTAHEQNDLLTEEMKSITEEMLLIQEEMRLAAETQEVRKEELQSINEELKTVIQELNLKVEEARVASNNLQNLMDSTNIGTIFLDRSFRVALYTPAANAVFNLIPEDHGRPLAHITTQLRNVDILARAQSVLQSLVPVEEEVQAENGNIYLMRLAPYRMEIDSIEGVVLTFFDITTLRNTELTLRTVQEDHRHQLEREVDQRTRELKKSRDRYLSLVENTPDVITRWGKDLKLLFANTAFESKTGVPNKTLLGKTNREMGQPPSLADPYMKSLQKAFETGKTVVHFNFFGTPQGEVQFYSRMTPEKNPAGDVETVLAIARDISDLRSAEEETRRKQELLQATMNSSLDMIQVFEAVRSGHGDIVDFRWILINHATREKFGEVTGKSLLTLHPGVQKEGIFEAFKKVVETGIPDISERHYVHEQFEGWFTQSVVKLNDGVVATTADITERKTSEREMLHLKDRLGRHSP